MTAMTFDTPLRPSSPRARTVSAVGGPGPAPVRLTRRGRVLLLLLLVGAVLVAFSLGRTSADAGSTPPRPTRVTVVQPGETLWAIAARVAPDTDPRRVVAHLSELNNLGSSPIVAGQRLVLPPA
jgi:Tfp pilus assembly protein FimV